MAFSVDKQTLDDLNLLGRYKPNSIFNVFNHTRTRGGGQLLEMMFAHPLSEPDAINKRSSIFQYFQTKQLVFPINDELFELVDHYLSNAAHANPVVAAMNTCRRKLMNYIGSDKEFEVIYQGLIATIEFMNIVYEFNSNLKKDGQSSAYHETVAEMDKIFQDKRLAFVLKEKGTTRLPLWKVARYDYKLRYACREEIKRMMQIVYEYDVYITVTDVARKRHFSYAKAHLMTGDRNCIDIVNVSHPQLVGGIANSVRIDHEHNVLFLTGANMAGKSTFMKSFSIAVYLAHMGFPVAAEKMDFTVQDGMYTSINVPDNLNMGYSHFYAEVLRVKHVAEEVAAGKNLVIIFDELFKGTNVKDAHDATVAVTEAFSENRNCSFIISTHIIEAGHDLKKYDNFRFVFLPTIMEGNIPRYTYRLQEGITNDRHGMMIINNEHIVDIIKGREVK